MTYVLERFGTLTLPEYNRESDVGMGASRESFVELPGGGLWDSLGSEQAPRAANTISFRGTMAYDTPELLDAAFNTLRAMRGQQERLYRRRADDTVEWTIARLIDAPASKAPGMLTHQEVSLKFRQESPLWNGVRHAAAGWFLDAGEFLDDGLTLDEGTDDVYSLIPNGTATLTVNNAGNGIVKNAILTISPGTGSSVTVLDIKRKIGSTVYEHLVYTAALSAGNLLVIDCGAHTVLNNGVNDYNNFDRGASHRTDDWLRLMGGNNTIEITLTGGNALAWAGFTYYDGWE